MKAEKANQIALMARVLQVSRSGFYAWQRRSAQPSASYLACLDAVRALHRTKRASLGVAAWQRASSAKGILSAAIRRAA